MSLEDLRRLNCEAQGIPYVTEEQQKMLEAADEAQYQQQVQQQQLQQTGRVGVFDTRPQGIDVYFLDRLITVKLPQKKEQKGMWMMNSQSALEQLITSNFDATLYNRIHRDFVELDHIADGEGNEEILHSMIDEWIVELLMTKSRSDLPEKGIRERTAWITHKTGAESIVKMPEQPERARGLFDIFRRR